MKTRRGFFAAIVGAVAAPLALKLFPKREDPGLAERKWLFNPSNPIDPKYLKGLFTAPWPPPYKINLEICQWKKLNALRDEWPNEITITEYIPVGEAAKRYPGYVLYPEPIGLKLWPDPPIYPMRYQPLQFHRDAFALVWPPLGAAKNVATNQGEQNS
jgi:hypothetical protein